MELPQPYFRGDESSRVPHVVGSEMGRKPAWLLGLRGFVRLVRVCLRRLGRGGGGDAAEAGRFGDAEGGVERVLAWGQLARLAELAVG
jgi:hypothetical protein